MKNIYNKTKIVATIGPGSESAEVLNRLFEAGVAVTRLNMSHGDQEEHGKRIHTIRTVAKKSNLPIAILQDLSGPKIRIGDFATGSIELEAGQTFILTGDKGEGDNEKVYFNYPHIQKDIKAEMVLMLDDGKKKLVVEKVVGNDIYTKVLVGGNIKSRRGVNIPGAYLSISTLSKKDKDDLSFGIAQGVDFVALSFVRTAKDITELKALIKKAQGTQAVIAKIETQEAVDNIDKILEVSDGLMVARGDLAIEIGPAKVPSVQKMIVRKCNEVGKPVIVATQMLESMINSPVPTRAEVSDVANAIFDGADAVMLSEETALGKYPIETVSIMRGIAQQIENEIGTHRRYRVHMDDIVDSVSSSVVHNAEDVKAKIIITLSEAGFTPRMIARYKPAQPVIALTPYDYVARQLNLVYGCTAIVTTDFKNLNMVYKFVTSKLPQKQIVKSGDRVLLAAGVPFGISGGTNMLSILTV